MAYKEITPTVWKPVEPEDFIEGTLVSKEENKGSFKSNAYFIRKLDNELSLVWGAQVLDERMKFIKPGDKIKIVFKETKLNAKNQSLHIYAVYKDE